ncbi:MAG TPA: FAD-binding oxidoreductase [Verrucomicrobiae bacterium]|nr:FAD-binding oxidoreductase [Verrucomicrobiae bacterium]
MIARPTYHLIKTVWNDKDEITNVLPAGRINDASRLNETNVTKIWEIPPDQNAAEQQLAELLQYARTNHLKVSIAGARHSMGGHVIYPGGIVIDMLPFNHMELDGTNLILHVQAGARWNEIIRFLNAYGLSVAVMQSNDDFSVGGSLSVNCHGWQFNRPPIDSTVESFRLMLADGRIVKCSRVENQELFSLVLGGYGLFGIILDVDLRIVPNEKYKIERLNVSSADYVKTLAEKTSDTNDLAMVYGRLRVTAQDFLQDGILNIFHRLPSTNHLVSSLDAPKNREIPRAIFRGSVGSEYGKELRWNAEKYFSSVLSGDIFERNEILYEPSDWFSDHSTNSTDILIECFVPPEQFEPLLVELRKIIPESQADLLNVTVRDINRDDDSFLRYADKNMLSLVMLFSQKRDAEDEAKMSKLTQEIITAALQHDGRYYLPYRLHATPEQFNEAYSQAKRFFELKRKYDPNELFQNEFYLKYSK